MNMPGFTAELSSYQTKIRYQTVHALTRSYITLYSAVIQPAQLLPRRGCCEVCLVDCDMRFTDPSERELCFISCNQKCGERCYPPPPPPPPPVCTCTMTRCCDGN